MRFTNDTPSHTWITHTYADIVETANEPGSVAVLPVGSVEQHGHHLPTGTDSLLAEAVVAGAVDRVADSVPVVITPVVWSGYSPHHLPFGGTMTLEADRLVGLLEDVTGSALENGFDAVLLVNGHGGNASLVDTAVSTIGNAHPDAEMLGVTYFDLAESFVDDVRESDSGGMAHGGEFETALMLHCYPELVDEDRIEGTPLDEPYDRAPDDLLEGGPLTVYRPFDEYSESGAIGAPELATAAAGERIYGELVDELAALLTEIHGRNRGD